MNIFSLLFELFHSCDNAMHALPFLILAKGLNNPSNLTQLYSPLKPPWYLPVPTCFEWTKTATRRRRWEVTLPRRSSSQEPYSIPCYHAGIWLPPYPRPAPLLLLFAPQHWKTTSPTIGSHRALWAVLQRVCFKHRVDRNQRAYESSRWRIFLSIVRRTEQDLQELILSRNCSQKLLYLFFAVLALIIVNSKYVIPIPCMCLT